MPLSDIEALVSDMDGVLWRGDEPLPAMPEFFAFLREHEIPFILATNNAGRHPANYIKKLERLGVPDIKQEQIITSSTATADYLKTQYPAGTKLYAVGNPDMLVILEEAGFVIADEDVKAVVVGLDFNFTYEKAKRASLLIRNHGAAFIGTNPDLTFPSPEGLFPGGGSVVAMVEAASGVEPLIIGKPKRAMFDVALQRLGSSPEKTLMIGDRIDTDIEGGKNAGLQTAMVLTGVNQREDIADIVPDYVFEGLPELIEAWKNVKSIS